MPESIDPKYYVNQTGISHDKTRAATVKEYIPSYFFGSAAAPAFRIMYLTTSPHAANTTVVQEAKVFLSEYGIKPAIPKSVAPPTTNPVPTQG